MLRASPALAARFPAVINFPGYTAAQLAAIFAALASEAGFTLTPGAPCKAAAVLAEVGHGAGNARLAVRLLDHAAVSQARRVTPSSSPPIRPRLAPSTRRTYPRTSMPTTRADDWPGQYL